MDNTEKRLEGIFETVFPDLSPDKVRTASQDSLENWDSIAAITLMNLIEEEFGIQMDFDDAERLTSFSEIMNYLNERVTNPAV